MASFTATPTTGPALLTVTVDTPASSNPDGPFLAYSWDWDDGSAPAPSAAALHTCTLPGTCTATLTDSDGAEEKATTTIVVQAPAMGTADPIMEVEGLPGLPDDVETGLTEELDAAHAALDRGDDRAATNNPNACIDPAKAQRRKGPTPIPADETAGRDAPGSDPGGGICGDPKRARVVWWPIMMPCHGIASDPNFGLGASLVSCLFC